jgi:hypothetical protein
MGRHAFLVMLLLLCPQFEQSIDLLRVEWQFTLPIAPNAYIKTLKRPRQLCVLFPDIVNVTLLFTPPSNSRPLRSFLRKCCYAL